MDRKHESLAMRVGHTLGRGVGKLLRAERALWASAPVAGLPSLVSVPTKWLFRGALVGVGVLLAAWSLAVVMAAAAMVALVVGLINNSHANGSLSNILDEVANSDSDGSHAESDRSRWMTGPQGYGYYDSTGFKQHQ